MVCKRGSSVYRRVVIQRGLTVVRLARGGVDFCDSSVGVMSCGKRVEVKQSNFPAKLL